MITNTQLLDKFIRLSRNQSAVNREFGQDTMNQLRKQMASSYDWPFLEKTYIQETTASVDKYILRADVQKVRGMSYKYDEMFNSLNEIDSWETYQYYLNNNLEGIPNFFYIENKYFYLISTPDTSGQEIRINYKKRIVDLTKEDTTTGTIEVENGSNVITGTGTSWNTDLVGQYINTPDGQWYEVVTVPGANALTIDQDYLGEDKSGASYVIGQVDIFPEGYEYLTLYIALSDYFAGVDGSMIESQKWENRAKELQARMKDEYGQKTTSIGIDDDPIIGRNLYNNIQPITF